MNFIELGLKKISRDLGLHEETVYNNDRDYTKTLAHLVEDDELLAQHKGEREVYETPEHLARKLRQYQREGGE